MTTARGGADGRLVLLAGAAGAFGSLDTSLNIAFPDLVDAFDLQLADLQWVVVCYVLSYGALLLAAGRWGDRAGHRRVLTVGAAGSGIALIVCALAPSYGLLLSGRVAQGVTAALVMASAPALLSTLPGAGAERAVSVFQTAAGIGLALGPVIGGPLVALFGWRGVFWFRVPLAVALMMLALRQDHQLGPATGTGGEGGGLPSTTATGPMKAEIRFTDRRFIGANAATALVNGSMFVVWLLVPTLLIDHLDVGASGGGLLLALSPLGTAVAARRAPGFGRRWGAHRTAIVGGLVMVAGLLALAASASLASLVAVGLCLTVVGIGLGLFTVPNMAFVMDSLPSDRQGVAGGLSLVMRTFGIVAGVAAAGALFENLSVDRPFITAFQLTVVASAAVGALTLVFLGAAMARPGGRR